ncbi:MAG TPA: alpha-(1-_3)-arabinofuranosyltransferase family protein, partial [Acidimicrobiales bacterium]
MPPLFTGELVSSDLRFPEDIPQYWHDATAALDARDDGTRVLELPGSDFAVYRWGETQDPITPGLMDRPWIGRELTAYGTPGTVDLLRALDRRLQEGVFDERAVAPIARLFAAGDLLWRSDTQYERYRGPRPRTAWDAISRAPGLGEPLTFGDGVPNVPDPRRPMRDELELGTPLDLPDPPALAVFPVEDAPPIVHARPSGNELVVAGDGESLVDAAEAGLLGSDRAVLYSASFANDPDALVATLERGADLLLTDGNRRRAQRWGTVKENNGFTEQPGAEPLEDDSKDTRLALFPDADDDARTIADYRGVADVEASSYGNIVAYSAESRPSFAIDGDLRTAWRVGGFADVIGERIRVTLDEPVTTDVITVAQTQGNRFITQLAVRVDGEHVTTVSLGDESFTDAGQVVDLGGMRSVRELELEVVDANVKGLPNYLSWSTVGLREIGIPGVQLEELIRLPRDLLRAAEPTFDEHDLTVLMSRWRADPGEPFRDDPEPRLLRAFELPGARDFTLRAEARIEARADGEQIDAALGRPGLDDGYPVASGADILGGDVAARPSAAIDGDPATAWSPEFGGQVGRSFHVALPEARTFDRLDLVLVADGWHSVPTQLTLELDEGEAVVVDVPRVADGGVRGHTVTVAVTLPAPVTTSGFVVRVSGVRDVTTTEYFSGTPTVMPVAIAELGIDGVRAAPLPTRLPSVCRSDLLSVDGRPVPVVVNGTVEDAIRRRPLAVEPCGDQLRLDEGEHVVRTSDGRDTGIAVDRVVLESPAPARSTVGAAGSRLPELHVDETGRLSYEVDVTGATEPFWLVLGQSLSDGWQAEIDGTSLGEATLIDGYANGWRIDPAEHGDTFRVSLRWTPQRGVWAAVIVSGIALVALTVAAVVLWRRHPTALRIETGDDDATVLTAPWVVARPATGAAGLVATGLLAAVVAWSVAGVAAAVAVGAIAVMARVGPRLRGIAVAGIVLLYPATAAWYVAKQWRNAFPPGVEWPALFGWTHTGVLVAVLGLGAVAAADVVRARRDLPGSDRGSSPATGSDRGSLRAAQRSTVRT